ncbi:hypothetical protein [Plastoroseomonas arctica]|uniref:Uncharacterized protein n=1 Tax=Plastoroseomonas arctica TaxID=1509237 RepID=A0AAF1KJJ0_9PROT|nr:hypothetical protein [Plastoroseomonas arctica]MBR0655260.1 hypothetical protein [Plastoroseomonas arctica]
MTTKPSNPGSSRKGDIDTRSTDANGKQADEVETHAERAGKKPDGAKKPDGETSGALKDQVGH